MKIARTPHWYQPLAVAVFVGGIAALTMAAGSLSSAATQASLAGAYQCWKFNVGMSTLTQVGQKLATCTSPDLVLSANGTYTLGSEKGTFTVTGDRVSLSVSAFRGPGTLGEQAMQISFEYDYKGRHYSVTYLKRGGEPAPSAANTGPATSMLVPVELTLLFSADDKSIGWINTATLMAGDNFGAEALAVLDGKSKIKVSFRQVRTGKIYTVYVSNGFEKRAVGKLDLLRVSGRVGRTIRVEATQAPAEADGDRSRGTKTDRPSALQTGIPARDSAAGRAEHTLPTCNTLVPRYAQPQCAD